MVDNVVKCLLTLCDFYYMHQYKSHLNPLQTKYRCSVHRCPYLLGSKVAARFFWGVVFPGKIFGHKHFLGKPTTFYVAVFHWKQLSISGWKSFSEKGNAPFRWTRRCVAVSKHGCLLRAGCTQKPCIPLERNRVSIVRDVDAETLVECPAERAHISTSHAFERGSLALVNTKRDILHPILMGKQTA